MMKSVEPNADLPAANSNAMLTYSALPVRRPYHQQRESPRNMTGVYLSQDPYGLPSNKQQQQRIPPLAKPRGMVYQPRMQPGYLRQGIKGGDGQQCTEQCQEGPFPVLDPDFKLGTRLRIRVNNNRAFKAKQALIKQSKAAAILTRKLQNAFKVEKRKATQESGKIGLGPVDSTSDAVRPYFTDDDDFQSDFISPNVLVHPFQLFQLFSRPPRSDSYCYIPPNLPYAPPLRVHIPTPPYQKQQHRQDQMVRSRDEAKAFQPLPMKKAKARMPRHEYHGPSPHVISPRPDYHAVTRKSARNRVPASNDGVTHFEDLRSNSSGNSNEKTTQEPEVIENMLDSISLTSKESEKSLAGLVDCYKKICKGNSASVHNLVASRTSSTAKHKKRRGQVNNAPLLIRSFRNPQHPHSVVQYSNPRERTRSPHTGSSRPPVPAPYFYSSKGLPQTSDEGGNRVKLSRLPGATSRSSDTVLAAPGVGSISRSNGSRAGSTSTNNRPPEGVEGTRPPSLRTNAKIIDSDAVFMIKENFNVPASTPVASTVDINRMSEADSAEHRSTDLSQRHPVVTLPASNIPGSIASSTVGATPNHNGTSTTGGDMELTSVTGDSVDSEGKAETQGGKSITGDTVSLSITISVEDDSGHFKEVEFQEEEGNQQTEIISSETDVSANEVAEKQKVSQAKKQAELDQLLEEHHQLVSQIEELEKIKEDTGDSTKEEEEEEGAEN